MKFKNILFTSLLVIGLFFLVSFANAEESTTPTTAPASTGEGNLTSPRVTLSPEKRIKNEIENLKNSEDEKRTTITDLKNGTSSMTGRINGVVTTTDGTKLTVKNDNKMISVTTDADTKCERHYFGSCTVFEISVNDRVQVFGTFSDTTKTTLLAKVIRDASIMKKFGTFMGDVVSKTDATFVIKSKERGQQTVRFTATTKFVQRNEKASSFADLQVGNRVYVRGVWDKANNTISEVAIVKNFSIPALPPRMPPAASPSASTELSPSLTVTRTATSPATTE